jgi:hypothetical protein
MRSLAIRYLSCTVQSRAVQSTDSKSLASPRVPLHTSTLHGQSHLIVPVVALVGNIVLQAANAPAPEFIPMDCLYTFRPATWDLRPVLPDHPQDSSGKYTSAKSPGVYDKHAFGLLFNTRISNGKLLTDAWINLSRASKVGAQDVVTRLQSGEIVEVSVGINVLVEDSEGEYNDGSGKGAQRYAAKWVEVVDSDHLAMLPVGMEGACSVKDGGCGAGRINAGVRVAEFNPDQERDDHGRFAPGGGTVEPTGYKDPNELETVNPIDNAAKLDSLVQSMKENGWQGEPILIVNGETWTGSHRIEAARQAELSEVPVYEAFVDRESLSDFGSISDDDDRLAALESIDGIDKGALAIMRAEVVNNGRVNSSRHEDQSMKTMADGETFDSDKRQSLQQALIDLNSVTLGGVIGGDTYIWVEDFNDTTVIYSIGMETFERTYTMNGDGGGVTLNNDEKQVRRKTVYEPMSVRIMKGLGVLGQMLSPGPLNNPLRASAGARHSAKDQSMVQAIHDTASDLGASCGDGDMGDNNAGNTMDALDTPQPPDPKSMSGSVDVNVDDTTTTRTASTCACKDSQDNHDTEEEETEAMNSDEKKALVSKLITAGKFKENDRVMLGALDDSVLALIGTIAEPAATIAPTMPTTSNETVASASTNPPTTTTTLPLSDDQLLAMASPTLKSMLLKAKQDETQRRGYLVQVLSNAPTVKTTLTMEQLIAKPTEELELLGKVSGVLGPVYDYSGSFAPMTPLSSEPTKTPEELRAAELRRKPLTASRLAYQEKKKNRVA